MEGGFVLILSNSVAALSSQTGNFRFALSMYSLEGICDAVRNSRGAGAFAGDGGISRGLIFFQLKYGVSSLSTSGRPLSSAFYIRLWPDKFSRSKLAMARHVASVLIFAGLLPLVAGMPQVNPGRDHGPRPATGSPSRPGPASQFGPGGRPLGPGADSSRVFRCPGCNEAFGSQYALRQHRKRFLEQHSESPAGAAAGPLRE